MGAKEQQLRLRYTLLIYIYNLMQLTYLKRYPNMVMMMKKGACNAPPQLKNQKSVPPKMKRTSFLRSLAQKTIFSVYAKQISYV